MGRTSAALFSFLDLPARHGRLLLISGLLAGILLPNLAVAMKPWIPEMIGVLLFLAAFRVGPRQAFGAARDVGFSLSAVLMLQVALPVAMILAFLGLGWAGALPAALVLMAAAPPVSGSPNLTMMTGNDPAPALRLLTVGTALLPLTVIPVFWLSPALGSASGIFAASGLLLLVIAVSVSAAFVLRWLLGREPVPQLIRAIDGLSAIVMGIVVIGLMSAVGPALTADPIGLVVNLVAAFAINFGLQIAAATLLRRAGHHHLAAPVGIVTGNRNIALFLTALPATVADPLLLFIGCYQIPMYLTPLLLNWLYRKRESAKER